MPSRASTSRSHLGCTACKARHVKCDQLLPVCKRCARHERNCSLSEIFQNGHFVPATLQLSNSHQRLATQRNVRTARLPARSMNPIAPVSRSLSLDRRTDDRTPGLQLGGTPTTSTAPPSADCSEHPGSVSTAAESCSSTTEPSTTEPSLALSTNEEELFNFYIQFTANTLNEKMSIASMFRTIVPSLALTRPYLLHGLLALAGLHRLTLTASSGSTAERTNLQNSVLEYQNRFLGVFQEEIHDRTTTDDCVAVCFGGILVLLSSLASYHHSGLKALDKAIEVLRLQAGVAHVFLSRWHEIEQSEIGSMLTLNTPPSPDIVLEENKAISLQNLERLCSSEQLQEADRETYSAALRGLQTIYRVTACRVEDAGHRLGWIKADAAARPADLTGAKAPEALLVIAHWAVLLDPWPNAWWAKDVGGDIVREVNALLPTSYRHLLQWPLNHFKQP